MRPFKTRLFFIVLLSLAVVVSTQLSARADTALSLQTPALSPAVGNPFDVLVNINSVNDLYAFQFDISFNPAIISATSVLEGSFLSGGGSTFFIPGSIDNVAGTITFTANTLLTAVSGVSGTGALADIGFQALAQGTSPLGLSNIILLDSTLSDIPFTSADTAVTVNSVPVPAAILLFGPGLVSLITIKRRLKKVIIKKIYPQGRVSRPCLFCNSSRCYRRASMGPEKIF